MLRRDLSSEFENLRTTLAALRTDVEENARSAEEMDATLQTLRQTLEQLAQNREAPYGQVRPAPEGEQP